MSEHRRVVITGIGAVTPLGNTVQETWEGLKNGKNGIAPITHFDTEKFKAKLGAEVKNFDPKDYLEVNDVLRTDRYVQYAVAAAQEAVDESGIQGHVDPERFSVLFGTGTGGIGTFEQEHEKLLEKGPRRVSSLLIPMLITNMAAGVLEQPLSGDEVMATVTACASSANAIGEAMRMIRHGYADAVIAGGSEAAIRPSSVAGFINMQALSTSQDPNAASIPFDKRRMGFVIGEGAAAFVLEEYEHARARGARICAEVVGYGANCDAHHITAPVPGGAMLDAMKEAGWREEDRVYINAHGTGTPMNDSLETTVIKNALGEPAAKRAYVSSTKSMTGHMLGAAGAMDALACVFALKEGIIPPTINLEEQDEACDLNCVPKTAVQAELDLALSNSLGFGGHNACLAFRKV